MLIKVQTAQHADSFLLIDRVDSVRYEANPREFASQTELSDYIRLMHDVESAKVVLDPRTGGLYPPDHDISEYVGPLSEKRVYRLNTMTYERHGEFRSLVFDTIAYICNDDGKTLEKAIAGGVLNY